MKHALIAILVVVIIGVGILYFVNQPAPGAQTPDETPTTTPTTTPPTGAPQATYTNATADVIVVTVPVPGAAVPRTMTIAGQARGNWFFEASFPFEVVQPNGSSLLTTFMEAQGEWMTTNFVPFTKTVTIPGSYTGPATLILRKDNPSGLPEHDASVSIPIVIQ